MFGVLKTLVAGSSARAEERLRDHFALDLLEQKVREAEANLATAKETLASLIMRERAEGRALEAIKAQIRDLEDRTRQALAADDSGLVETGAKAIADLENERDVRVETERRLKDKVARMRMEIDKSYRRLLDLKQGLTTARAIDAEQKAQTKLNRSIGANTSMREAEELLQRLMERDDPLEESAVLDEIDNDLTHVSARDRMAEAGYGPATKVRADDVLARLKETQTTTQSERAS
ncbi:MAG: PspA/IM30 family protein [Pseudomonadota bacterium]